MREKGLKFIEFFGMVCNNWKVYDCWNEELFVPVQKIIGQDMYRVPVMDFADFAIGIDTGLSDGEGKVKKSKSWRKILCNNNVFML